MPGQRIVIALLLTLALVNRTSADAVAPDKVRAAVGKSLPLLDQGATGFTAQRQCFSCHHQALPVLALVAAKGRGFTIDDKSLQKQLRHTAAFLEGNRVNYAMGKGQGGQADTAGYALWTLHAGGWQADATTAAVIEYLLRRDQDRDHWQVTSQRPPSEASSFTTTFLVLSALRNYGPKDRQQEIDARIEKARRWLLATRPKDTEDRVFRLRALRLAGAEEKDVKAAAEELAKTQRQDGGWGQLDTLDSDAYATGSVLAALHQAGGLSTKDAVYQRGVAFLVRTQQEDGSWRVVSRSKPFQAYFESGFPHGKDQWISCAATGWATVALLLTCEP
jgi:hypothetical protein